MKTPVIVRDRTVHEMIAQHAVHRTWIIGSLDLESLVGTFGLNFKLLKFKLRTSGWISSRDRVQWRIFRVPESFQSRWNSGSLLQWTLLFTECTFVRVRRLHHTGIILLWSQRWSCWLWNNSAGAFTNKPRCSFWSALIFTVLFAVLRGRSWEKGSC